MMGKPVLTLHSRQLRGCFPVTHTHCPSQETKGKKKIIIWRSIAEKKIAPTFICLQGVFLLSLPLSSSSSSSCACCCLGYVRQCAMKVQVFGLTDWEMAYTDRLAAKGTDIDFPCFVAYVTVSQWVCALQPLSLSVSLSPFPSLPLPLFWNNNLRMIREQEAGRWNRFGSERKLDWI